MDVRKKGFVDSKKWVKVRNDGCVDGRKKDVRMGRKMCKKKKGRVDR